jgi:hypothetical protein
MDHLGYHKMHNILVVISGKKSDGQKIKGGKKTPWLRVKEYSTDCTALLSFFVFTQIHPASFKLSPTVFFLHTGNKLCVANSVNMVQNRSHHHDHIILKMLICVFVIALSAFRHASQY